MEQIERIKFKKILTSISNLGGDGTSMITLLIPNRKDISQVNGTLTEEYGAASNIKSRVNRLSVLSAITSAQQKLKLYNKTPKNGLCLLIGTVVDGNDRKQISLDFEPPKPLSTFLYKCDASFHLDDLFKMLEEDKSFGYLVMDGHGFLVAKISGSYQEILHKEDVSLPPKHGRGGQSALRFARLRESARHNYLRKISETMTKLFIDQNTNKVKVDGLVIGGSADLKTDVQKMDFFDPRLLSLILKVVDINYSGRQGLNETIAGSEEVLSSLELNKERKELRIYFDLIATNLNKVCFGEEQTIKYLNDGILEKIFIDENHQKLEEYLEIINEKDTQLTTISANSAEGTQFIKGFGGVGAILRYENNMENFEEEIEWLED